MKSFLFRSPCTSAHCKYSYAQKVLRSVFTVQHVWPRTAVAFIAFIAFISHYVYKKQISQKTRWALLKITQHILKIELMPYELVVEWPPTCVNSNYRSVEIAIHINLEAFAVSVVTKIKITICNIYLPNSHDHVPSDIQNIINQFLTPYILLGYFNSHSSLWGCIFNLDLRGTIIEQILYSNSNFNILNNSQPTRINPSTSHFSAIGL
jgi:hypothetical protein